MLALPSGVPQATAEQLIEPDDVLGAHHVTVAVDQHHGHGELLHVIGPVVGLAHELTHAIEQARKVLRPRRHGGVVLVHRRVLHVLGHRRVDRGLHRQHFGKPAVPGIRCRCHHESAHTLGMLHGQAQGDGAAHRVAHHIKALMAELPQDDRQVVGHVDVADGSITERGAAMTMQIDTDHLALPGECAEHRTETLYLAQAAVQQQQRPAPAMDLVVVVDTVDRDVATLDRLAGQG